MSGRIASFALLVFLSVLLAQSCIEDAKGSSYALEGRWELERGYRNQRETGTLNGTYFQFGADGKMITNLPVGPEAPMAYEIEKAIIRQKSTPPVEYEIRSYSDSALILGLVLRGMQFELHLRRADAPAPLAPSEDSLPPEGSEIPEGE